MFKQLLLILACISSVNGLASLLGDDGWEKYDDSDGIQVYRKEVPGTNIVAVRGHTTIDQPVTKIVTVLLDTSKKTEWVFSCKEAKLIEAKSKLDRVEYNHTGTPWPVRDRDFLYTAKTTIDAKTKIIKIDIHSVEHPGKPDNNEYVRGQIIEGAYTLVSLDGGKKTELDIRILVDPKGSLPQWLVNKFQKKWPNRTFADLKKQVEKPGVEEDKDLAGLLSAPATK